MRTAISAANTTPIRPPVLAALCALMAALAACSSDTDPGGSDGRTAVPTVSVLAVASRPFTTSFEFIGETEAFRKVDIRARVTGPLEELAFTEGGPVDEGALLFRIDSSEFDAAKTAAAAGLERAEATLLEARQTLERSRELAAKGTVSQAKLDEAVAAESRARADVSAAQAELDRAELDLSYTKIHTPISGRIGKSGVDTGNLIGPDSGVLATVVALDPMRAVFSISERTYLMVEEARRDGTDRAYVPRLRLATGEFHDREGMFSFADNQVDEGTGTIRVYLEFPNPDLVLVPGLFVTVVLSSEETQPRILVPQAAVQLNQSGPFVLVVDADSRVRVRQVETGERDGGDIVIASGLEAGETIIVEGIQKVRPGSEVATVPVSLPAGAN